MEVGSKKGSSINAFAFSLLLPISVSVEKVLNQKNILRKVALAGVLAVLILGLVFTGSRGSLVGTGVIFMVYILSMKKKLTLITVVVILGIIMASILPGFFVERFQESIESGGAGRTSIWYVGLLCLKKHWITGAGFSNFPFAYTEFANYAPHFKGYGRAPHNIYLGYFVDVGIVGFTLLIMVFIQHYKSISLYHTTDKGNQVMLKAAFWAILTSSFFLDTFFQKPFWLLWMLIMMYKTVMKLEMESHSNYIKKAS